MQIHFVTADPTLLANLICRDAGPAYAQSLKFPGWWGVDSLERGDVGDVVIVDHTMNGAEVEVVRRFIERRRVPVLLKIVDSYWSRAHQGPYSQLVKAHCADPNVAILTPYEPNEWLKDIITKRDPKVLVLPYPYVAEAQLPLMSGEFYQRIDRCILTGALARRKYPSRALVNALRYVLPGYRRNFDVLKHPGYPSLGEPRLHNLIFGDFVKFVAAYKYFFICPSRANLEFLKYTECAYAGCVPVGTPATSLPASARELFLSTAEFLHAMRTAGAGRDSSHFERATMYREIMSRARHVDLLRAELESFVRSSF